LSYFKKAKVGDKVFGLVFGKGEIKSVWNDGHYVFEVEYDSNGQVVPYTEDGVPGWSIKLSCQTVFYAKDIDIFNLDFSEVETVLTVKKIIKLRNKKELEIKCPSGIWQEIDKCPGIIMEEYLEDGKLHLFRKLS